MCFFSCLESRFGLNGVFSFFGNFRNFLIFGLDFVIRVLGLINSVRTFVLDSFFINNITEYFRELISLYCVMYIAWIDLHSLRYPCVSWYQSRS